MGKIGQAFAADQRTVLLIDEIDKADTDFQDDMLDVLDQMEFDIIEIDKTISARHRPVIIITSNAKKDLSDPFLGRCNFHHIAFPDPKMMRKIIGCIFPNLDDDLVEHAIAAFYRLRELEGVEKRPATRELINWIRALNADPDFKPKRLAKGEVPLSGGVVQKKPGLLQRASGLCPPPEDCSDMFLDFFYKLKEIGVPVSPTAFLTLHRALGTGLVELTERFLYRRPGPSW